MIAVVIAALFFNIVPDSPGGESVAASEISTFVSGARDVVSLYTFTLPRHWTEAGVVMKNPLRRYREFAVPLRRDGGSVGILLRSAGHEGTSGVGPDLAARLAELGEKVAKADPKPALIMVDGLFNEMIFDDVPRAARAFRSGVDRVDPALRVVAASVPGVLRSSVSAAKELAAKGSRPLLVLDNFSGMERSLKDYPAAVMSTYAKTAFAGGCDCLDDADTFPHNLWSRSVSTLHAKTVLSLFCGAAGAGFWYVGCREADGSPVSGEYTEKLIAEIPRYRELVETFADSEPSGVAVPLSPRDFGFGSANWGEFFFGFTGIPFYATYRRDRSDVYALMGSSSVSLFSDDELSELLGRRILIDGDAALELSRRGFSGMTGVDAVTTNLAFNCEQAGDGSFLRLSCTPDVPVLRPVTNSVEELSWLVRRKAAFGDCEKIAPAATFFENPSGGKVIVTAFCCRIPRHDVLNESRRTEIVRYLERLAGAAIPGLSETDRDLLVLARRLKDGRLATAKMNLSFDTVGDLPPAGVVVEISE